MTNNQELEALVSSKQANLAPIIDDVKTKRALYIQQRKDERLKKKNYRPIPSLLVMKNRLKVHFSQRKNELIGKFKKNLFNPYLLNSMIEEARLENRKIIEFNYNNPEDVKNTYLKYFWYLHWIQNKEWT